MDNVAGTVGNDTINAAPAAAASATTFNALDKIDGGAGTDTLNVTDTSAAAFVLSTAATVKNVEVLNVTTTSDNVVDTLTADVSAWIGLTTANFTVAGTDADMTLTTKGNATSVSINGSVAAGITDSATTDTLATVTATDATGLVTVTSDALTTLTLNNSDAGATVVAAAATRALTVNLNGIDGGVVADAQATTLNVNSSGTKTTAVTLNAAKATTVTVDAAVATTITDVNVAAATIFTVKGAGAVTLSAASTITALTNVDASASTGGATITPSLGTAIGFAGGSGADSIKVGATTKAITTGAGNDTVIIDAVAALGSGGSIDAGAGIDTINFNTYANAVTATASSTFAGTISGFEKLELSGVNSAAAAVINLANLDNINDVTMSATNTETTTISGMTSGGTLTFKANQTAGKAATVSMTNAATGTADVLNIGLSKATALASVEVVAANIETINITSTETATTLTGTVTHAFGAAGLSAVNATTLNVSGNAGVTFGTLTGGTALTTIDASGVTTGLVSLTTDALTSAATIKGGAGDNTIVATAATKAVTYTGQGGVDTITINNANNNTVNSGAGNDVIVTGSGADTITAGAGNDTITSGKGLDIIDVGTGDNTFVVTGNDNGNIYASITGMDKGDKIDFIDGTAAGTFAATKISLASTAAFADYLAAATASTAASTGANGLITWFQYSGDTYVVQDKSTNASFTNGTDQVVKLVGLIDLSTATIDGATTNVLTLG